MIAFCFSFYCSEAFIDLPSSKKDGPDLWSCFNQHITPSRRKMQYLQQIQQSYSHITEPRYAFRLKISPSAELMLPPACLFFFLWSIHRSKAILMFCACIRCKTCCHRRCTYIVYLWICVFSTVFIFSGSECVQAMSSYWFCSQFLPLVVRGICPKFL